MSEQTTKPPKKKNTLSERITLDGGKGDEKPPRPAARKKPSVSTSRARVDMPGKLKGSETQKNPSAAATAGKPKPAAKKKGPASGKSAKPTKGKVTLAKKRLAPPKGKPVARAKVVPPKVGSRRGYRPSLAFRLRIPVFLIAFAVCALALFLAFHKEAGPVGRYVSSALAPSEVEVTIEAGMSAKEVSLVLKESAVVEDDQAVLQFFTDNNLATTLRSGVFMMEKGMAFDEIARLLTTKVGSLALKVSPSFTLDTIDRYLANRGYAKKGEFLKAAEALRSEHSLSFVEGWLLSGVYVVPEKDAATALAQSMFDAMLAVVQPHLNSEQVAAWGLEKTLIIASMIQAETQDVQQMPLIASVIYNRLEAGEPLGIDATTRYEIDDWENPIPKKALETKSPYNTRRKVGLPPSGICSPSKEAVEAALFPAESPYFYYLHGLDKRLYLAVTYDEHKENIKAYR